MRCGASVIFFNLSISDLILRFQIINAFLKYFMHFRQWGLLQSIAMLYYNDTFDSNKTFGRHGEHASTELSIREGLMNPAVYVKLDLMTS